MITTNTLNLARKWRSQNFDEVIGQNLPVRMLKNSLYTGQYFPVYLLSGQRGCGKTTTARVFAAAINCEDLTSFQKDPKETSVPCLSCASCRAMRVGNHPDFIEIDAASHTGVDNVRAIIDAASLAPLMGHKKIYLIDEAHMLSKAAFNALLKILEEPPATALFMLATTDPHKIIDTVKSRCFQLFFQPVATAPLTSHLQHVCKTESITYDDAGLALITKETDGSVRDALNLIEQVRFSGNAVTKQTVLHALGYLDDDRLIQLLACIVQKQPRDILCFLNEIKFESAAAARIWQRFAQLVRALLWAKHGVISSQFSECHEQLNALAQDCSFAYINRMMDAIYNNEQVFARTTAKHALLEMIFLQLCQHAQTDYNRGGTPPAAAQQLAAQSELGDEEDNEEFDEDEDQEEEEIEEDEFSTSWKQFLQKIVALDDPLISSVFSQSESATFDASSDTLQAVFPKDLIFFNDMLQDTHTHWLPVMQTVFGKQVVFNPVFTGAKKVHNLQKKKIETPFVKTSVSFQDKSATSNGQKKHAAGHAQGYRSQQQSSRGYGTQNKHQQYGAQRSRKSGYTKSSESIIDVSDQKVWQKVHTVLQYFPGTVYEMREGAQ